MNKHIQAFLQRGLIAMSGGPLVLGIVYGILGLCGVVETLTVAEVVRGIFSASILAFIAAGITVVYQLDRLPLMAAIGIHGAVLYLDYILIYLINGWLKHQMVPVLIFTICFVLGYALVWLLVWLCIRKKIGAINAGLKKR